MGYIDTQMYIKSLQGRGIVPGLSNEYTLLEKLNNPQNNLNFIHIAGTNGKGSVGAYLSGILCTAKYEVCRFVSPCVGDYSETFLLNGKPIDVDIVSHCTYLLQGAISDLEIEGVYPTSFEAEAALAFMIFNEISPDYVLLECGMGGKYDATNVIPSPVLSVITKIAMDHTAFLGDTLEEIAKHKAGIIKDGAKVVTTPENKSLIKHTPIYYADKVHNTVFGDTTTFSINDTEYKTQMLGAYQPENAAIAVKCGEILGIDTDIIKAGILNAAWEFRFEKVGKFILDGAHNPDGAKALVKSIHEYFPDGDVAYVCACFKDKEYKSIAEITAPYADSVYCVTAPTERGLDRKILCSTFTDCGAMAYAENSLEYALKKASLHNHVIVFGTLSILKNAKEIIQNGTLR